MKLKGIKINVEIIPATRSPGDFSNKVLNIRALASRVQSLENVPIHSQSTHCSYPPLTTVSIFFPSLPQIFMIYSPFDSTLMPISPSLSLSVLSTIAFTPKIVRPYRDGGLQSRRLTDDCRGGERDDNDADPRPFVTDERHFLSFQRQPNRG